MATTYRNSKIIYPGFEALKDATHHYYRLNAAAFEKVVKECKPFEVYLWIYCHRIKDDNGWAFSPQALIEEFGGSDKSWREARQGLENKGYLVQISGNGYRFDEVPQTYERDKLKVILSYEVGKDAEWIEEDVVRLSNGELRRVQTF